MGKTDLKWKSWKNISFTVIDHFLSIFIFATLVVFYWRGTWNILNIYLFPHYPEYTAWASAAIGIVALEIFYLLQHELASYVTEDHMILYIPVSRIHSYVFAFANVNHWRGVWLLLDFYSGITWLSAMVSVAVGTISLCMLRSFRNVAAPPAAIVTDTSPTHFTCSTRFRRKEFGGSKTLPPSRRPPVCRSMHIPQFEYAHYGIPKNFQNTTHHRQTYCNKKTEPATTMHFPTFLNKVHMNQGTDMKTSIHADSTTNYNSQYNRIHNKLGSALGPGVKRSYPERKSYNIITGRDEEVKWANDVDWRQISGNRVLSAARQVTWSPITGEPLVY